MVETLKDDKGKPHIIFDRSELYDDSIMGNKLEDFEILQVLGRGAFGFVAKVRSKINKKIYAMKQINFEKINEEKAIELCKREIKIHQKLEHPHIVKYYKNFEENNCLYAIMEFMDNKDMKNFIEVHEELNKPIKEETIWNILLQSISALTYLHNNNVIHRDIKPGNIFMNNDKIIKLGDFGVSAITKPVEGKFDNAEYNETVVGTPAYMALEIMNNSEYDFNVDVYSLGCSFFEMCYFEKPRIANCVGIDFDGNEHFKFKDNNITKNLNYYSKELMNIINLMIIVDKKERKSSKEIYELVKKEYYKKFKNNSSISAVIRCMFSLEDLTGNLLKKTEDITKNKYKAKITHSYLFAIKNINKPDFNFYINKFRQEVATENSKLENGNEIDPRYIIIFLLERLHKENNIKQQNNLGINKNKYIISSAYNGQDEDNTVEDEMLSKYLETFTSNFNSIISNSFFGMYKTKRICKLCNTLTYSFNSFCIAFINLDEINSNNNKISLKECIKNNLNCTKFIKGDKNGIYCDNCLSYQDHEEIKSLYKMPNLLIFSFGRGIKYKNKTMIDFPLILDLDNQENIKYVEHPLSPIHFQLVGVINFIEDNNNIRYISFSKEHFSDMWYFCDLNDVNVTPDPMSASEIGFPVLLFYQSIKGNK